MREKRLPWNSQVRDLFYVMMAIVMMAIVMMEIVVTAMALMAMVVMAMVVMAMPQYKKLQYELSFYFPANDAMIQCNPPITCFLDWVDKPWALNNWQVNQSISISASTWDWSQ